MLLRASTATFGFGRQSSNRFYPLNLFVNLFRQQYVCIQCCFKGILWKSRRCQILRILRNCKKCQEEEFSETVKIPNRQPLLLRKWRIAQKVSVCACLWHCARCVCAVRFPNWPWLPSVTVTLCIWVHPRWRLIRMKIEDVAYLWYLLCCSVAQKLPLKSLLLQSHFKGLFINDVITRGGEGA